MSLGKDRFQFYFDELQAQLLKAREEDNPALYLYEIDCRTTCFMLEGLAKLYAGLHNKKIFKKFQADFKQLEDVLGDIDYFDGYAQEFMQDMQVPINISAFLVDEKEKSIKRLNKNLKKGKWLKKKKGQLADAEKQLKKVNWLDIKEELAAIEKFYGKEIEKINMFAQETSMGFTELEDQVHEMRRNIRWLSIYPKALQGAIQLTSRSLDGESLQQYLTPSVLSSKYNVMPDPKENSSVLLLERNYFYALSWLISKLGDIKDIGLKLFALTEAVQVTENVAATTADKIARNLLHVKDDFLEKLLSEASEVTQEYFAKGCLTKLVVGVDSLR